MRVAVIGLFACLAVGAVGEVLTLGGDSSRLKVRVQDTFLSQTEPQRNFGRDRLLSSGGGTVLLLDFVGVENALPPGAKIESARLVLNKEIGGAAGQVAVRTILRPWGEGPGRRNILDAGLKADHPRRQTATAATWEQSFGGTKWSRAGAKGELDAQPLGLIGTQDSEEQLILTGLEVWLRGKLTGEAPSFGLAIEVGERLEFTSSENPEFGPKLEVTYSAPAAAPTQNPALVGASLEGTDWVLTVADPTPGVQVKVFSQGSAPVVISSTGPTIRVPGIQFPATALLVAPGDTDLRAHRLSWAAAPKLTVSPGSTLDWNARIEQAVVVESLNSVIGPGSRFSFALQGVSPVVGLAPSGGRPAGADLTSVLTAIGLSPGNEQGNVSGYGDSRDEGDLPGLVPLLRAPTQIDFLQSEELPDHGLLCSTDVVRILGGGSAALPSTALLRLVDLSGQSLVRVPVQVQMGELKSELTTNSGGVISWKLSEWATQPELRQGVEVKTTLDGRAWSGQVQGWQLVDARARSGGDLGALVVLMRPEIVPDSLPDLALDRFVTVSGGGSATALVDGDAATGVELPNQPGDWIEIDLGRDRLIGQISIAQAEQIWSRFDVLVYATGETPNPKRPWIRGVDRDLANSVWRIGPSLVLTNRPISGRYIRLVAQKVDPKAPRPTRIEVRAAP